MRKENNKSIKRTCKVTDRVTIMVTNAFETYGHDDSLPYNADLYASLDGGKMTLVAYCSNDGWGGDSCIRGINSDMQKFLNDLSAQINEKYVLRYHGVDIPCHLDLIVDMMAEDIIIGGYGGEFWLPEAGIVRK